MSTNFPTSLDSLVNPTATDGVATVSHSSQHANANDAIEALEAKVGVNGSAVTTTHDYKLSEILTTDKAVGKSAEQTLILKTLTTPVIASIYQDAGKTKLMSLPNTASDTLVALDATQTLKNKTITDNSNDVRANSLKSATTTISLGSATAPTTGQVLTATNSTTATWQNPQSLGEDELRIVTVSVSAAEIKALNATPKQLIAAPGAGKCIFVDEVIYSFTYVAPQYTNGSAINVIYAGGSVHVLGNTVGNSLSATTVNGSANYVRSVVGDGGTPEAAVDTAIQLKASSTEYATGNGTLKIFLKYRIITL